MNIHEIIDDALATGYAKFIDEQHPNDWQAIHAGGVWGEGRSLVEAVRNAKEYNEKYKSPYMI